MQMSIGQAIRLTLFGTSHGPEVGAIVEGLPSGIVIDADAVSYTHLTLPATPYV